MKKWIALWACMTGLAVAGKAEAAPWMGRMKVSDTGTTGGVASFSYSEPAVWLEYVLDVARVAREHGLYTVYVSNSFVTDEALELAAPHIDVLCSDIKSMRDDFYREICRPARVE